MPPVVHQEKNAVREFWNADPCGTRYLGEEKEAFDAQERTRYALEPYIAEFAGFARSRSLRVLEVGVGIGADYLQWLKAGAHAVGIDLSSASISRARQRCLLSGFSPRLHLADAENLPFAGNVFDVVYSYGVMHHSPNTTRCIREAWRVLKPGGEARIMVYHQPSATGAMLWLRYGLIQGKSLRQSVYDHLESPGTKTYTREEARALMSDFRDVQMRQVFSPGDLLLHKPSARFQSGFYRLVWKLFPRSLVRRFWKQGGLFLLITAKK